MNLQAFKNLVEKYRSITEEDVNSVIEKIIYNNEEEEIFCEKILRDITGFGHVDDCSLCEAVYKDCSTCLHALYQASFGYIKGNGKHQCLWEMAEHTYFAFEAPFTSYQDFMRRVHDRADYLQLIINWYEKEQGLHLPQNV